MQNGRHDMSHGPPRLPAPSPAGPARRLALVLAAAAALAGPAAHADRNQKAAPVYKWVDETGVVHYGDAVPPQAAERDKTVLNDHGVPVNSIPGRRTPEQLEAEAAERSAAERAKHQEFLRRQYDQNLLATYLTVEEIESLRDRRIEILDAQTRVTLQYLDQLRARLATLEKQARNFRPYVQDARPLPDRIAEDLVRTVNEIRTHEQNLAVRNQETEKLKTQFARDVARFRELKRIEAEYARAAQPRT